VNIFYDFRTASEARIPQPIDLRFVISLDGFGTVCAMFSSVAAISVREKRASRLHRSELFHDQGFASFTLIGKERATAI